MKVQSIQIPGTAETWAREWNDMRWGTFEARHVEIWASEELSWPAGWRDTHRLADRLIQKGRELGLWTYTGGHWRRPGITDNPRATSRTTGPQGPKE